MLDRLIQEALQKALTKVVSRQVERAVTDGVAREKRAQYRSEAFLSGWYVGLQLTYAGGFLVGALALCIVFGLLIGETQVLFYFVPIIALMLALIFWARSRRYRVLFWPNALVLEKPNGETAAEFTFSQTERISIHNGKMTFRVEGKTISIACHPQENRPAYDRLAALLRQHYSEKIHP